MKKRDAQELSDAIVSVLRAKRQEEKISQYKMAKDTGMSKSSILYIENLTQRPALYTVLMLADYLNFNLPGIISDIILNNKKY